MTDSFPRQYARTQRFTLGRPRSVTVADDGSRVLFLRSAAGDDRVTGLHVLDVATATERQLVDPRALLDPDEEDLPPEERARRERAREGAGGIVAYSTDAASQRVAFTMSGRLFVTDVTDPDPRELDVPGPVVDPRLSPDGRRIAYVVRGRLRVVDVDAGSDREVIGEDGVTWGLADFVAAEEMNRLRGHWWSPDSDRLLAARVDDSPVQRWWIADPAAPATEPTEVAYPAAGTDNALVTLAVVGLEGEQVRVEWDTTTLPYLTRVTWSADRPPVLQVQSRDQRRVEFRAIDPATGATTLLRADADEQWVELVDGVPAWLPDGRLVTCADRDGARRVLADDEPLTPPSLSVRGVVSVGESGVLLTGSEDDPAETHVYRVSPAGALTRLSAGAGVHSAAGGGDVLVLASALLAASGTTHTVLRAGEHVTTLTSYAQSPAIDPRPELLWAGERRLRTTLLLPAGHDGRSPLPVLMDPYGGPHAQRVVAARDAYLSSQWLADQGFAVVIADGRGTPGRGSAWERSVHRDLAEVTLQDQVDALQAVAAEHPGLLDLAKVAIRGWSFGGYLAALAVLRRPDVFAAAVAGAPVTDWRLYDTHYTERYLGVDPTGADREAYDRTSLLDDAPRLTRPLLLIHGLADDNVVAAHTLQLSGRLLAAGRPHNVLPLSGVTHMTPQEEVAENLLLLQVDFLRRALALG